MVVGGMGVMGRSATIVSLLGESKMEDAMVWMEICWMEVGGLSVGWLVGCVGGGGSAWVDGWGKLDEGETERRSKKVAKTHDFRCIVVDVG